MAKVRILKKGMKIEIEKDNLIGVEETSDGVVFNLKNNVHIYNTDGGMPVATKQMMQIASDREIPEKSVMEFNLMDHTKPVQIIVD